MDPKHWNDKIEAEKFPTSDDRKAYEASWDRADRALWSGFIGRVHVVNTLAAGYALALIPTVIGFVIWRDGISGPSAWGAVAVIFAGLSLFGAYLSSSLAALYPEHEGWHKASGVLCCLAAFIAWLCILSAFLS